MSVNDHGIYVTRPSRCKYLRQHLKNFHHLLEVANPTKSLGRFASLETENPWFKEIKGLSAIVVRFEPNLGCSTPNFVTIFVTIFNIFNSRRKSWLKNLKITLRRNSRTSHKLDFNPKLVCYAVLFRPIIHLSLRFFKFFFGFLRLAMKQARQVKRESNKRTQVKNGIKIS